MRPAVADGAWSIEPGSRISRDGLHAAYGGRLRARITTSTRSPNLLVVCDPPAEEAAGLVCGRDADGCLHLTGEGAAGDQRLRRGNASLLGAAAEGLAIRLFTAEGSSEVAYCGRFALDADAPLLWADAPDPAAPGHLRSVAVFRLRPAQPRAILPPPSRLLLVAASPPEVVAPRPASPLHRWPATPDDLVAAYAHGVRRHGWRVERQSVSNRLGERLAVMATVVEPGCRALLVASMSTSRAAMRAALGELADLGRVVRAGEGVLLLPVAPRDDLLALARHAGVRVAWPPGFGLEEAPRQASSAVAGR